MNKKFTIGCAAVLSTLFMLESSCMTTTLAGIEKKAERNIFSVHIHNRFQRLLGDTTKNDKKTFQTEFSVDREDLKDYIMNRELNDEQTRIAEQLQSDDNASMVDSRLIHKLPYDNLSYSLVFAYAKQHGKKELETRALSLLPSKK